MLDALSPLGDDCIFGGDGAIYLWAKLPTGVTPAQACMSPRAHIPVLTHYAVAWQDFFVLSAGCEDDEAVVSWLVRQHKARTLCTPRLPAPARQPNSATLSAP